MAENRRQHYVPQFYLRGFSKDGKNLAVFNLEQDKGFYGSIRTICSESYFYGRDIEQEKSLAPLESKASEIVRKVIASQKMPDDILERFYLFTFMMLQHVRTAAAKDAAKLQTKQFSDTITEAIGVSDFKLTWEADHAYKMLVGLTSTPLIMDLKIILLVNNTKRDFIVSDNPVTFHNTKFNKVKSHGTKGVQSRGLQIFWPITRSLSILLYDPVCYDVAIGNEQRVDISSEEDVFALNSLQYLYCREILLFTDRDDEDYVREIGKYVKQLRKERTVIMKKEPHPTKLNAEIIHVYNENLDYDLKLSFIHVKDGIAYGVRDPVAIEYHRTFFDEIMKSKERC